MALKQDDNLKNKLIRLSEHHYMLIKDCNNDVEILDEDVTLQIMF